MESTSSNEKIEKSYSKNWQNKLLVNLREEI